MPNTLARRFSNSPLAHTSSQPASAEANPTPAGEICPEALSLLRDCAGPTGLFALLRMVLPVRQAEIARLMIARGPVSVNYVKMLVALTPHGERTVVDFTGRTIAGTHTFLPNGIAVAPGGSIYVDAYLGNGWTTRSVIAVIRPDESVHVLWHS